MIDVLLVTEYPKLKAASAAVTTTGVKTPGHLKRAFPACYGATLHVDNSYT